MRDPRQFLDTVNSSQTVDEVLGIVDTLVSDLGFDYFSLYVRKPVPGSNPAVAILDHYPAGWMDHYQQMNYLACDPTIRWGATHSDVMCWSPRLFEQSSSLWRDAQDIGLKHGVAQSSWARHGSYALFSMARSAESVSTAEQDALRLPLYWAASTIHARLERLLRPESFTVCPTGLSDREREAMSWTADGKTASEIAPILGLTKRTVDFHINNAAKKLNASNKTHAVVNAMGLGLIDPD